MLAEMVITPLLGTPLFQRMQLPFARLVGKVFVFAKIMPLWINRLKVGAIVGVPIVEPLIGVVGNPIGATARPLTITLGV